MPTVQFETIVSEEVGHRASVRSVIRVEREDSVNASAHKWSDALKQRIRQRRSRAAKVLQSLHTHSNHSMSADGDWKDIFSSASRKEAQDLVMNMMGKVGRTNAWYRGRRR